MEKTSSYTYFQVVSNGKRDGKFEAYEGSIFDPKEVTALLGLEPFSSWAASDKRRDGSEYSFSKWSAEKSEIGRLDVEAQCRDTIRNLRHKIPQLKRIKEQWDVRFVLNIVPEIYEGEQPNIIFEEEVIEFCHLTGTTISVDMYIYESENADEEIQSC